MDTNLQANKSVTNNKKSIKKPPIKSATKKTFKKKSNSEKVCIIFLMNTKFNLK